MSGMRGYAVAGKTKMSIKVAVVGSSKVFSTHLFLRNGHTLNDITTRLVRKYPNRVLRVEKIRQATSV